MNDVQLLLVNAIVYTVFLLYMIKQRRVLSVGMSIWILFTFSAWMSFFFIQQPLFQGCAHDFPQNPEGLIYLFVVLLICIYPLFDVVKFKYSEMYFKNERFFRSFIIVTSILQLVFFIVDLPQIGNILQLGTDSLVDMRENVYDSSNSIVTSIPFLNRFHLIYIGLKPIAVGLSVILLLCYNRDRKIVRLFFIASMLSILQDVIITVSRGEIISYSIYLAIILIYFRDFISPTVRRVMVVFLIPIIFLSVSFFGAITYSRFGDLAGFMMFKYPGEPMINFNGILYPNLYEPARGHAYLLSWYFREAQNGEEKWMLIENLTHVRADIFYTFVGGFFFEFGKIGTIVVAIILNFIIRKTNQCSSISFIFIVLFFSYFYSYGVFLFKLQGFQALFFVLFTLFLYRFFYFKNNELQINTEYK